MAYFRNIPGSWRSGTFGRAPLVCALVAAALLSAAACDDDEMDDNDNDDGAGATGGVGGTGGTGGTLTGGNGGTGGTSGTGGSAGNGGTGGDATGGTNAMGGTDGGGAGTGGSAGAAGGAGEAGMIDPDDFDGQQVFRYDTFGDERLWTDTLHLNEAIQAALDPTTALSLGLKVDAEALPPGTLDSADLTDPATTVALIELDAVVGVKGKVDASGTLVSVGITCALCHSDVDDSVMEGIGARVDGAANRDLDPGAIIALSPGLAGEDELLEVYNSWGPGYYDPRFNQDGINHPVLIPPIYGLADVPYETYTGDGPISYWNSYVAVTQMGGIGNFFDPRIDVAVAFDEDIVTPKLPALYDYQVSLEAPVPDDDAFDPSAAARGDELFEGDAECGTCHTGPAYTDAGAAWHTPEATDMDPVTAERSATGLYRTTPLRALLAHPPYFHDGSAETLADVVDHYDTVLELELSADDKADLVEYLKSL